jgi:hypothetical protein
MATDSLTWNPERWSWGDLAHAHRSRAPRHRGPVHGGGSGGVDRHTAHLDRFAYIAGFSGGGSADVQNAYNGAMRDANDFNSKIKVFYLSMGTKENIDKFRKVGAALEAAGIKHVAYEAPGTAHEFQTWRKSLHGFAQLIFQ